MKYNLVHEKWIPIRRQNGERSDIAPWQLTEEHATNPIVALDSLRPDFNGALAQFLLGLLQTSMAPQNEMEWRRINRQPPSPEVLKEKFSALESAFNLLGSGPRFLQDQSLKNVEGESLSVACLLIEYPGENTTKENKAFFIKGTENFRLSLPEAAMALFCLQTNAPSGGQGHRTSLRGGGPLTTLVWAETLWESIWLNVLPEKEFAHGFVSDKNGLADKFPWMGKLRTSEPKGGRSTYPEDAHPTQYYWAVPRRIWLIEDEPGQAGDGTVGLSQRTIAFYRTVNYGMKYEGAWKHPLSPYSKKGVDVFAMHPQPGGIGYRHWLGLVVPNGNDKSWVEPARVARYFLETRGQRDDRGCRLWAFGYDMDNMKARCWYEGMMPLVLLQQELRPAFEEKTRSLVLAADEIARNTQQAVSKVWFSEGAEVKGDLSFVRSVYWSQSEPLFYGHLDDLKKEIEFPEQIQPILESWFKDLCRISLTVFDHFALSGGLEFSDPKRIAQARQGLDAFNHSRNVKVTLGLPVGAMKLKTRKKKKIKEA